MRRNAKKVSPILFEAAFFRKILLNGRSPRVSKGGMLNQSYPPLLTRGLLSQTFQGKFIQTNDNSR
jgi:hypothetical protein